MVTVFYELYQVTLYLSKDSLTTLHERPGKKVHLPGSGYTNPLWEGTHGSATLTGGREARLQGQGTHLTGIPQLGMIFSPPVFIYPIIIYIGRTQRHLFCSRGHNPILQSFFCCSDWPGIGYSELSLGFLALAGPKVSHCTCRLKGPRVDHRM